MITLLESRDAATIALEVNGKATQQDAEKLERTVQERFGDEKPFNLLGIVNDLDGSTGKGMLKGLKFDTAHWKQFRKIAVVSEENWIKNFTESASVLPGIKTKHFKKDEMEFAWHWLQQPEDLET